MDAVAPASSRAEEQITFLRFAYDIINLLPELRQVRGMLQPTVLHWQQPVGGGWSFGPAKIENYLALTNSPYIDRILRLESADATIRTHFRGILRSIVDDTDDDTAYDRAQPFISCYLVSAVAKALEHCGAEQVEERELLSWYDMVIDHYAHRIQSARVTIPLVNMGGDLGKSEVKVGKRLSISRVEKREIVRIANWGLLEPRFTPSNLDSIRFKISTTIRCPPGEPFSDHIFRQQIRDDVTDFLAGLHLTASGSVDCSIAYLETFAVRTEGFIPEGASPVKRLGLVTYGQNSYPISPDSLREVVQVFHVLQSFKIANFSAGMEADRMDAHGSNRLLVSLDFYLLSLRTYPANILGSGGSGSGG